MSVPTFREFLYPVLEILGDEEIYTKNDIYKKIIEKFDFTNEELNEKTKQGSSTKIEDRITWALTYLNHSPLIIKPSWGKNKITEEGLRVLDDENVENIDEDYLMQYPEFRIFKGGGMGDPDDENELNHWLYSPGQGAYNWNKYFKNGIMGIGFSEIGDLTQYKSKGEILEKIQVINQDNDKHTNEVHAFWQFANEIKKGDIIYAKKGMGEIIGYGIVEGDYYYDTQFDENHHHLRKVNWKIKGSWEYDGTLPMKTLTQITKYTEMLNTIENFFDDIEDGNSGTNVDYPSYSKEDFLNEVFFNEEEYNTLTDLINLEKNLIIEGAPGVGKTYISKRLAYSIMGVKDKSRVELVQFHQSYSYEDFIMGYRPSRDGFKLENGIFYDFCKKAEADEDNKYFFIIDEINRGNLSRIFGELFMLIEADKRGNTVRLLYNKELFSIPRNLYIIGLMNTADRSLAMLDYALRRRFAFYDLKPAFDTTDFKKYMNKVGNPKFNQLVHLIDELNNTINNDEILGEGFQIGHSYFTNLDENHIENNLEYIIEYKIIPLLKEYWFDEKNKVDNWSEKLRSVML